MVIVQRNIRRGNRHSLVRYVVCPALPPVDNIDEANRDLLRKELKTHLKLYHYAASALFHPIFVLLAVVITETAMPRKLIADFGAPAVLAVSLTLRALVRLGISMYHLSGIRESVRVHGLERTPVTSSMRVGAWLSGVVPMIDDVSDIADQSPV